MTKDELKEVRARLEKTMPEAEESLSRLIASAFGMGGEGSARLSIPARPDHDDDLIAGRAMRQAMEDLTAVIDHIDALNQTLALAVDLLHDMHAGYTQPVHPGVPCLSGAQRVEVLDRVAVAIKELRSRR